MIAITVILTVLRKKLSIQESEEEEGKNKKTPEYITYISSVLPYAIMGMLVVYCLKDISITAAPHRIPELIAGAVVVGLHLWKRNTLLSIVAGTVVYMLLIQCVF